jgi:ATP phosphoribosyltransferase regulatory subunit
MRDLLPVEARERGELVRRVLGAFELFGYERVVLPMFEHARVLERGLGAFEAAELLQFVEPDTGEIVALRPDMTPQVARLWVSRLAERPGPARLAYDGSVLRRPRARARKNRQIPQAGVELLGAPSVTGDLEIIEVAVAAARAAGLERFVVDVGHVGVARALLSAVPEAERAGLVESLALKDATAIARRIAPLALNADVGAALAALPTLHGAGPEVWARAHRLLDATPARAALVELERLWNAVRAAELVPTLLVDLGEISSFEYYTGMTFQVLAEGPGEPIASGGRYDHLLERFGVEGPAAGCAFDLDNLAWALRSAGAVVEQPKRVLVALGESSDAVARALRAGGLAAISASSEQGGGDPLAHGRAWRYSHVVRAGAAGAVLTDLIHGTDTVLSVAVPGSSAAAEIAAVVGETLASWADATAGAKVAAPV